MPGKPEMRCPTCNVVLNEKFWVEGVGYYCVNGHRYKLFPKKRDVN